MYIGLKYIFHAVLKGNHYHRSGVQFVVFDCPIECSLANVYSNGAVASIILNLCMYN